MEGAYGKTDAAMLARYAETAATAHFFLLVQSVHTGYAGDIRGGWSDRGECIKNSFGLMLLQSV